MPNKLGEKPVGNKKHLDKIFLKGSNWKKIKFRSACTGFTYNPLIYRDGNP